MEKAAFGAGCFWGVEEAFRLLKGVTETAVGYMGGHTEKPTYEDVCSGTTNHAETVLVTFDPQKISYDDLLAVFWASHDPTQLNRQGPDSGTQYRSVIFTYSDTQRVAAEASKAALERSGKYPRPIVTAIQSVPIFYKAEDYHQRYLEKRGGSACHLPG